MKNLYYFLNLANIFSRFSLVGFITTAIYFFLTSLLIWSKLIHPVIASSIAYFLTMPISFWGHGDFTFQVQQKDSKQIIRYFIYSILGFSLSNLIILLSTFSSQITPYAGVAIVTLLIPILNFFSLKFFVFQRPR